MALYDPQNRFTYEPAPGYTPPADHVQAPQQPQADPGRSLNMAASDPLSFGGQVGSAAGNSEYANKFGIAMQGLLKQYQTLGTKPFQEQALNASDAQTKASTTALTNPSLQGYNPGTIMNSGQSAAQPFNPIIQGAQNAGQTFSEQIRGFGDVLNNAQNLLQTQQAQSRQMQSDAQNIVHDAISAGSDAVAALIKAQPDLAKLAGYNSDTLQGVITGLKKSETKKTSSPSPSPGTKSISSSTQTKYGLSSDIAQDEFDQVRNKILSLKQTSGDWVDAWGKAADWLSQNEIAPAEYDKLLWDLLHPGGLADYGKTSSSTNNSPF